MTTRTKTTLLLAFLLFLGCVMFIMTCDVIEHYEHDEWVDAREYNQEWLLETCEPCLDCHDKELLDKMFDHNEGVVR